MSYPVSFIFLVKKHWISVFISRKTVEVMDSAGFLGLKNLDNEFRRFLRVQLFNKKLVATPRLQSEQSNACGLYAISFLYYKNMTSGSLCDFCSIFTSDKTLNCAIIGKLYDEILAMNET